ncbi:septum formation initiator family protein [Sporosarcina siberiensis]|uniref:Septum formation initiator family protein n=1 Tax=Sporosarcina siberiensis TaxID=1365606 RepID=A0ABW4SBF6_9BACL
MEPKQQRKPLANVASIQTEYVRSLHKKEERIRARKVRLYRRLAAYAIAAIIILGTLTSTFINQKQALSVKEQKVVELLAELEVVTDEQEMLNRQIVKLSDDDYIAKLARKNYFLSDKNEIIFSTPDKKKK